MKEAMTLHLAPRILTGSIRDCLATSGRTAAEPVDTLGWGVDITAGKFKVPRFGAVEQRIIDHRCSQAVSAAFCQVAFLSAASRSASCRSMRSSVRWRSMTP